MNAGDKFLATAAVILSLFIIYRVAPGATIVMAVVLLALTYRAYQKTRRP